MDIPKQAQPWLSVVVALLGLAVAVMQAAPHAFAWLVAIAVALALTLCGLAFAWRPRLRTSALTRVGTFVVVLLTVAAVSGSTLADSWRRSRFRTNASEAAEHQLPGYIAQAERLIADYRKTIAHGYDPADPTPAERWQSDVCKRLTEALGSAYCTELTRGLPTLRQEGDQTRDGLTARLAMRVERLGKIQADLRILLK